MSGELLDLEGAEVTIASCELLVLSHRYPPEDRWSWPGGEYRGWTSAFARMTSDDGAEGIGEIGDGLNIPEAIAAPFDRLGCTVVGCPARPRAIVAALERSAPGWGAGGLVASIVSGIEAAVIDLVGNARSLPAHALLGGAIWDEVPVYASGGLTTDLGALHEELSAYVAAGYRAVKIRIGYGTDRDVARVETARGAVGDGVQLMVDLGASYLPDPPTVRDAARLARRLEPFDLAWLEDPLPRHDLAGHARLRRELGIPIAAGENERSLDGVVRMLDAEAVDVIQTDAVYIGGILRQLDVGNLANEAGVRLAPHTWCSGPGLMANATAVACSPAGLIVEVPQVPNPLRDLTLVAPVRLNAGRMPVPTAPGLGVVLPDHVRTWSYDSEARPILHNAGRA